MNEDYIDGCEGLLLVVLKKIFVLGFYFGFVFVKKGRRRLSSVFLKGSFCFNVEFWKNFDLFPYFELDQSTCGFKEEFGLLTQLI